MILRWGLRAVIAVAALLLLAVAARAMPALAVFLALVCGLTMLIYLVTRARGMSPTEPEQEREKNERFLRDVPPPSGG
jgi:hypothetical protein